MNFVVNQNLIHVPPRPNAALFVVAGAELLADPSGTLYLPQHGVLIVADLHLEKGSSFAARGMMLPPYDTAATLARLGAVIARYAPNAVIALGDSFHDPRAFSRLGDRDRASLKAMQTGRDWIWISGNHDPAPPENLGGEACDSFTLGSLTFRHEPTPGAAPGEIAGHLHPVARVVGRAGALRRRCFASDGLRCILPAFGAYAGGLNIRHHAFDGLFAGPLAVHALGRERVYAVANRFCVPDP